MADFKNRPLTDSEEARIQAGIALDPDNPELTDAQLASLRPAVDILPAAFFDKVDQARRSRGRPALDRPKKLVTLRLDQEVIDKFEATGKGWRARMNEALRQAKI